MQKWIFNGNLSVNKSSGKKALFEKSWLGSERVGESARLLSAGLAPLVDKEEEEIILSQSRSQLMRQ